MATYNDSIISQDARQEVLTPPARAIAHNNEAYLVTVLTERCLLVETEDGAYLGQCTSWAAVWRLLDAVEAHND